MQRQMREGLSFMKAKEEYRALFELGCADLKLVEKNLGDGDIREQLLLFHLQQAVEKFLKSLLSKQGVRFQKIHDLGQLIELCEGNTIELPDYVEEFINLTPFATEFRYGLMGDETLDVQYYCQKVLGFREFVGTKIFEPLKG